MSEAPSRPASFSTASTSTSALLHVLFFPPRAPAPAPPEAPAGGVRRGGSPQKRPLAPEAPAGGSGGA
eukprot:11544968-Alexandrium_andersonii.AAC.1